MLRMKILICVLIIAAFVDILCYRIPNLWIGFGMIAGMVLTVDDGGIHLLGQTLLQLVIIFVAFYPFYLIKGLGAGDVKLFLMLGCYVRGVSYLHCMFIAMLLAGIWAVIKMVWQRESRERLAYLGQYCKKVVLTGVFDVYEVDKGNPKGVIRLSVPVLCSVLLWYGGQCL
ncbi:MAG: prepilin peptidase [Lachnospiraceae bacterium]|nr:prepilin peptidase [Lachnospiraceae bacterium]